MKLKGEIAKFGKAEIELSDTEAKSLSDFMEKIIPDFVKETGGILSDTVKYWRWKNQIKIIIGAIKYLDQLNIEPKTPLLKIIVPLLENAALEENENIQDMWSKLLATALSGQHEVVPNFISTLKQLTPLEVNVSNWIYEQHHNSKASLATFNFEQIEKTFNIDNDKSKLILEDLARLGILIPQKEVRFDTDRKCLRTGPNYYLGSFGAIFIKSCKEGPIKT